MRPLLELVLLALLVLLVVFASIASVLGDQLRHVSFGEPWWLLAMLLPLAALAVRAWVAPRPATFRFSRVATLAGLHQGIAARLAQLPDALRLACAAVLVLALARPQSSRLTDRIRHEGIDVVIAFDLSDSMETMDMLPNRFEAAKQVIDEFIALRRHDRVGLVVFGADASTVSPLTMDHDVLRAMVKRLRLGVIDGGKTAIGAGVGVSLNRIDESDAASKVIVLVTDGVHNAGGLDPDSAASAAAERGVRVYTILIGRHGGRGNLSIDPGQLERIASVTGGYAYTAEDQEALRTSFQDLLDKLERSINEGENVRAELFAWLLWPALALLMLDVLLRNGRLRRFP